MSVNQLMLRLSKVPKLVPLAKLYSAQTSRFPSFFRYARRQRAPPTQQFRRHFSTLQEFILPDIGEGIVEVEVLKWHVKPGDRIKQFDSLCEVQSDKANVDITSRYDGIVESLATEEGEMAEVGKPLVIISTEGSEVSSTSPSTTSAPDTPSTPPPPSPPTRISPAVGKVRTTPAVRAIAKKHKIDLTHVWATGKGGRILKEDVLKFLEGGQAPVAPTPPTPIAHKAPSEQDVSKRAPSDTPPLKVTGDLNVPPNAPSIVSSAALEDRVVKVRGLQRTMVKTMTESNKVPTFVFSDSICVDKLVEVRTELKPILEKQGSKLSYMPFFLKATSLSLLEFPILNSHTNEDCSEYREVGRHNIGFAMDTPQGLIVPVIHNVQDLSITQIANELIRLQYLGERGKLGEKELHGGTFALSNIGSIGGTSFTALIVPPQVAIGAIGALRTVPQYDDNMNLVPTKVLGVSWSADHRIVDGATVARFHERWKSYLENPHAMLLQTR